MRVRLRIIEWLYLSLLFWILGDVADPATHQTGIDWISVHDWYTYVGTACMVFAIFASPDKKEPK